jgi:hypothetical protein
MAIFFFNIYLREKEKKELENMENHSLSIKSNEKSASLPS